MTTLDRVKKVVAKKLGKSEDEITEDAAFMEDLGADSLDVVELMMELESEFEIEVPDDEAEKIRTVGDAVSYIEQKTKS